MPKTPLVVDLAKIGLWANHLLYNFTAIITECRALAPANSMSGYMAFALPKVLSKHQMQYLFFSFPLPFSLRGKSQKCFVTIVCLVSCCKKSTPQRACVIPIPIIINRIFFYTPLILRVNNMCVRSKKMFANAATCKILDLISFKDETTSPKYV